MGVNFKRAFKGFLVTKKPQKTGEALHKILLNPNLSVQQVSQPFIFISKSRSFYFADPSFQVIPQPQVRINIIF